LNERTNERSEKDSALASGRNGGKKRERERKNVPSISSLALSASLELSNDTKAITTGLELVGIRILENLRERWIPRESSAMENIRRKRERKGEGRRRTI